MCAPDVFLPRILLCCGLPQSSFLSMIERLDKLGESSTDADKCFSILLAPSTAPDWGVGYNLKRDIITRKLYGRVKAYSCFLDKSRRSSEFVQWLANQCQPKGNKTSKGSVKKRTNGHRNASVLNLVTGIVQTMDTEVPPLPIPPNGTNSALLHLHQHLSAFDESMASKDAIVCIQNCVINNDIRGAEAVLEMIYAPSLNKHEDFGDLDGHDKMKVANELLALLHASAEFQQDLHRIVLRWIPLLTHGADRSFFTLFFSRCQDTKDISPEIRRTKNSLVIRCLASWSLDEIKTCQSWVLEQLRTKSEAPYCAASLLRCFLHRSSFSMIGGVFTVEDSTGLNLPHTAIDIQNTELLTTLALSVAEERSKETLASSKNWKTEDWMILLLLIGNQSKEHLARLISTMLVDKYQLSDWADAILPRVLLNLYATFPADMNLSDPNIREMLVNASAKLHNEWLEWSTPLDDQVSSAIQNLDITVLPTQQQLVIDFIKMYPLFAIKHVSGLLRILKADAMAKSRHDIERGRQSVNYPSLVTNSDSRLTQVTVLHWGSSFSEPLWVAALDILLSFPEQVLFSCGHHMGLLDILNLYLILFKTQIDVGNFRSSPRTTDISSIHRTRNKLATVLKAFSSSNYEAFADWVTDTKVSSRSVGDIMIHCGMQIE